MTNIYHQNIQRKLKKVNPLALPPAANQPTLEETDTKVDVQSNRSEKKKIANVFLTNDVSDTSSNVTTEVGKTVKKGTENGLSDAMLELERKEAQRLKEDFEREQMRKEEERKEDERKREEEDRIRREEEARKMRQFEREMKEKEEQEKMELQRKQEEERLERLKREEAERLLKLKEEEQAKLKFKEDEEMRKKKDLLLARMRAIDAGKGSGIGDVDLSPKTQEDKPKKLPIFLQNAEKQHSVNEPLVKDNAKQKFGSNSSIRSKNSKESYDVKESFQNLHHGLPAHPANQHYRGRTNSGQDEDLFGSNNKQNVGRHGDRKQDSFGSYNPSFGEPTNSVAKKQENKNNDVIFGSYQPSFSGSSRSSNAVAKDTVAKNNGALDFSSKRTVARDTVAKDNEGALDFSSKKTVGRRAKPNQQTSVFGEDLFNGNTNTKTNSIFDDSKSLSQQNKTYPWENKDDDSLLPRRQKLNHAIDRSPKKQVPAVNSILNGALDDDLEEVTL